eukprot:scaffold271_cov252-Pinguiococcus_pyrenoidosus.AAC.7
MVRASDVGRGGDAESPLTRRQTLKKQELGLEHTRGRPTARRPAFLPATTTFEQSNMIHGYASAKRIAPLGANSVLLLPNSRWPTHIETIGQTRWLPCHAQGRERALGAPAPNSQRGDASLGVMAERVDRVRHLLEAPGNLLDRPPPWLRWLEGPQFGQPHSGRSARKRLNLDEVAS